MKTTWQRLWTSIIVAVVASAIAGCSRSVEWDEEVLLNTGDVIWVHRAGSYTFRSESGNPLVYGYAPDRTELIAFTYRGRAYSYTSDGRPQVIAIAADGVPNLVLSADSHVWQWKHGYHCTRPSYVQLRPDATGDNWSWPPNIDSWLYGLPTNLLYAMPPRGTKNLRVTSEEKIKLNLNIYLSGKQFKSIDPNYQTSHCKGRT